jgi:2-oxoglutarate dehydrogenase E2 component (dihydrolipoamide succinyltransferase)
MRQRIAQRLKESQNTAACLTTYNEVDMSNLIAMRKMYKEEFKEEHEVPLGFMSAFVKATATTLQEMPVVNAYLDGETHEVVYHDFVDISIAVASPRGLVVPVLRDCQDMSFAGVEKTIGDLAAKARDESITLEEMAGGTFSITNGGVFGSLMSMPIINPPQSAILGMHATKMRPIAVDVRVC